MYYISPMDAIRDGWYDITLNFEGIDLQQWEMIMIVLTGSGSIFTYPLLQYLGRNQSTSFDFY